MAVSEVWVAPNRVPTLSTASSGQIMAPQGIATAGDWVSVGVVRAQSARWRHR